MNRRPAAVVAGAVLLIAAIAAAVVFRPRSMSPSVPGPRPAAERPPLMLLTTLPIVFPERLSLRGSASPVLAALRSRYRVQPISVADAQFLRGARLLLMAQPQAQPAEDLVALDRWVRGGGRVLLLADPALEWPSDRPLGDVLRPPFQFADTGLLAHWGLRLESPARLGAATRTDDGVTIRTSGPGVLTAAAPDCSASADHFIAHCRLGSGRATIIADADFLQPGNSQRANLALLLIELARLEQ